MKYPNGLAHTLAAYTALAEHPHIDDAVDALVQEIGWDAAFATLAGMEEVRASMGLYSMVCGLFIADANATTQQPPRER
ncbi:hypothetical protein [Euzebya sp.]|uniref:hypothetical protein n=1 Tax=Euzebya sp. TaxID=1971409 RepID=UPI00351275A8